MTKLLVETHDHVGTVTFNDDAKRNALSKALIDEFIAALHQSLRQAVFDSHDYEEGTRAIREKRQPVCTGQ